MAYKPYYSEEDEERKVSKYSSWLAQNIRLDKLWIACNTLSRNGQLMPWNWTLDAIWRELSADAKPEESEDMEKLNEEVSTNKEDRAKLYIALNKKEMFLRKMQNAQGKGTAYYNPEEDEMDSEW